MMFKFIETAPTLSTPKHILSERDKLNINKVHKTLSIINNKTIWLLIHKINEGEGEYSVTELYIRLRWEQSKVSQHLAKLRRAGLVIATIKGKETFYSINHNQMDKIKRLYNKINQMS